MEDDVIDTENNLLDFDDLSEEKGSTQVPGLSAKGTLSDVEIDYETRSEISDDDEDNVEDIGKTAVNLPMGGRKDARDEHGAEMSRSSMVKKAIPKINGKRRVSLTNEKKDFRAVESRCNRKSKKAEGKSKSTKNPDVEDSIVKTLFQDARFFLMKTSDVNNLKVSQERQVWFTDPQNVTVLSSAEKDSKNVILIFSAKWTGRFSGFALLKGRSKCDDPPRDWAPSVKTLGGLFYVKWLSRNELLFSSSNHLTNPSSGGKLVSICSDGQEIDRKVGQELCQLLLHKGVESKESTDQLKNELPPESQREDDDVLETSSKLKTPRRSDHSRDRCRHKNSRGKGSHDRERSTRLLRDSSYERARIRVLLGSGSNHRAHSPVWVSDGIERSPSSESNHTRFERRGRSPVRRERRVRGSDRNVHSPIGRSQNRERHSSREPPRRLSGDLRYKTSRGRYQSSDSSRRVRSPDDTSPVHETYRCQDAYSEELDFLSPTRSETRHYDSYDDGLDESAEPAGMSGRFVIERSPIRQTVANLSPAVHREHSIDNYDLMSEVGSNHQVEAENKAVVVAERYCTISSPLPIERSLSPERPAVSRITAEVPRKVYETNESLGRPESRGRSHVSQRDASDRSTGRRSLPRGSSQATYNEKDYSSYESTERRSPSHGLSETNRSVYMSHESIGRSQSRSRSRATRADYSSHEVTRRRTRTPVRSPRNHRKYEYDETSRRISRSHVRSRSTHRECDSYESTRISRSRDRSLATYDTSYELTRIKSPGRLQDANRDYQTHESIGRSSSRGNRSKILDKSYPSRESHELRTDKRGDPRVRRSPDKWSPNQEFTDFERDYYNRRRAQRRAQSYDSREAEDREVFYEKRSPARVMNSGTRSRYSETEGRMDSSSLHHISPELKRRRRDSSSERRDDRSRRYRDERCSSVPRRHTPESRSYLLPLRERAADAATDYYRHYRGERSDQEHHMLTDSGTRRPDTGHGRYQRPKSDYYPHENENPVSLVAQYYSPHVPPTVASNYLPTPHQSYYLSAPPPVLPPVSSKLLELATHPSPPKYNPTVPPPMIPPAPSKYVDGLPTSTPPLPSTYFQGGIPPPPKQHGQSSGGVWVQGQRSVPVHYNQTPSHKNLSVEEFIELCNTNKPMRGSSGLGSRRRY